MSLNGDARLITHGAAAAAAAAASPTHAPLTHLHHFVPPTLPTRAFSYPTNNEERDSTLQSLERRATKLASALDSLDGVACSPTHGSMYVFPSVALPTAAVDAAAKAGKAADAFYCLAMLDETGIVVVPGSGFGQKEGTFHFRATILPPEDDMDRVIVAMTKFHASFVERYAA